MTTRFLSIILLALFFVFIIDLVRREKLTFKYAAGWLLLILGALVFAVLPGPLFTVARLFGFELPSNFIFFAAICGFIFLSLILTIFLCQQNKRNDKIAQKLGLLEQEVQELKK